MKNNRDKFIERLQKTLHSVYTQFQENNDAPNFDKGIVKGMMISARTLNILSAEEITQLVNQEMENVFGTNKTSQPVMQTNTKQEVDVWYGSIGKNPEIKSLENYLDIPTFIRKHVNN